VAQVHLDARAAARLRVPRRRGGGDLDHRLGHLVVSGVLDHHVAAGCAAADVHPEVTPLGDVKREVVVVGRGPADEDLVTLDEHRAVGASLAGHGGRV